MEWQRSQLYACNNQFAFAAKIISKIKKNADPNQKSLRIKKRSPQTEKALMQIWFSFKWSEIKVSPHVAFTFGDHDHFKGGRTRCKHFKILTYK